MKAADISKIGEGIVTMADRLNFEHIAGEIAATFQNAGLTPDKWDDVIKSKDDVIKYLNIIESSKPTVSKVSNDIIKKGSESAEVIDFKGWNPNVIEGGKKPSLSKKEIFEAMEDNKGILEASEETVKEPLWKELGFTNREEFLATEASMGNPFAKNH